MTKTYKLKDVEFYIIDKITDEKSGRLLRTDLIENMAEDIFPDLPEDKIKNRLRKSIDKLTRSGVVQFQRAVLTQESRGSVYSLTEKGKEVAEVIESEKPVIYTVSV